MCTVARKLIELLPILTAIDIDHDGQDYFSLSIPFELADHPDNMMACCDAWLWPLKRIRQRLPKNVNV